MGLEGFITLDVRPRRHVDAAIRPEGGLSQDLTRQAQSRDHRAPIIGIGEIVRIDQGGVQRIGVDEQPGFLQLYRDGRQVSLQQRSTDDALQATDTSEQGSLLTPLPGTIVAVHVTAGQRVARGAPLVTVEAMKMEHTLTAPYAGVVTRVEFGVSERVAAGAVLVELTPAKD